MPLGVIAIQRSISLCPKLVQIIAASLPSGLIQAIDRHLQSPNHNIPPVITQQSLNLSVRVQPTVPLLICTHQITISFHFPNTIACKSSSYQIASGLLKSGTDPWMSNFINLLMVQWCALTQCISPIPQPIASFLVARFHTSMHIVHEHLRFPSYQASYKLILVS